MSVLPIGTPENDGFQIIAFDLCAGTYITSSMHSHYLIFFFFTFINRGLESWLWKNFGSEKFLTENIWIKWNSVILCKITSVWHFFLLLISFILLDPLFLLLILSSTSPSLPFFLIFPPTLCRYSADSSWNDRPFSPSLGLLDYWYHSIWEG